MWDFQGFPLTESFTVRQFRARSKRYGGLLERIVFCIVFTCELCCFENFLSIICMNQYTLIPAPTEKRQIKINGQKFPLEWYGCRRIRLADGVPSTGWREGCSGSSEVTQDKMPRKGFRKLEKAKGVPRHKWLAHQRPTRLSVFCSEKKLTN